MIMVEMQERMMSSELRCLLPGWKSTRSVGRPRDGALFTMRARASVMDIGTVPIKSASIVRFVDDEILLETEDTQYNYDMTCS